MASGLLSIDNEISTFVKSAEKNADNILLKYYNQLELIAYELILKETISGEEMKDLIITGKSNIVENSDNKTTETSEKKSRRKRNNS